MLPLYMQMLFVWSRHLRQKRNNALDKFSRCLHASVCIIIVYGGDPPGNRTARRYMPSACIVSARPCACSNCACSPTPRPFSVPVSHKRLTNNGATSVKSQVRLFADDCQLYRKIQTFMIQ